MSPGERPVQAKVAHQVAGWLLGAHVLAILGFTVFYVVEIGAGLASDSARGWVSVVVFLVMAALLGAVSAGLLRNARWARGPAVGWNLLLIPVAISLVQGGQVALGVVTGALAIVGVVAALASARYAEARPGSEASGRRR